MNKQQRNKAKESIKKSIEETQKDISSFNELINPIAPENAIGRVSRMDAINNKSLLCWGPHFKNKPRRFRSLYYLQK